MAPWRLDPPLEHRSVGQVVKGCSHPVEDADTQPLLSLPVKVLRALNVSSGVLLSSKEEAERQGAHKEVEVGDLVPLTEVTANHALLPE